jgi:putative NADPH-quinone reductase
MKVLLVQCHPLKASLCHHLGERAEAILASFGHELRVLDLYDRAFEPALTAAERAAYYAAGDISAVAAEAADLLWAEGLVIIFPTWWYGMPALLKGWFDRIFAPGVAYDHGAGLKAIRPRLHGLRRALVVTTLGSPWWVDWLVMHRPVRRILKTGVFGLCAPNCRFEMLSFYSAEAASPRRVADFTARLESRLSCWAKAPS